MGATPFEDIIVEVSDEDAGGHGDHWNIFTDDLVALLKDLPRVIQEADLAVTYSDNRSAKPFPLPDGEPKAGLLVWPAPRQGMIMVVELDAPSGANEFISMYPWVSEGVQHTVRLEKIRLWPNRLEAQVQGFVGREDELALTFFDPLFAANRTFYKKGGAYQFILIGFPYVLEVVEAKPIIIDKPDRVRELRRVMYEDEPSERDSLEPVIIQTKGMAALLPREEYEADAYEFHGPVKSVAAYQLDMLGQPVWRVRVTVARFDEEDFDLDLCLSGKVLGEGRLPEVGDDVRGTMWLQGYLWMPGLGGMKGEEQEPPLSDAASRKSN